MATSFQQKVYPVNICLLNMVDFQAPMPGTLWAPTDTAACSAIFDSLEENKEQISEILEVSDDNWHFLSDHEYDRMIKKLYSIKPQSFETKNWKPGTVLTDGWGRRYKIAFRKNSESMNYEFRVWTLGADGISGTNDDSVVPYKSEIPVVPSFLAYTIYFGSL